MPNVKFEHPDLKAKKPEYELIDDVMAGEAAVKKKGQKYLPKPNAADTSKENVARYTAYSTRAVFYNVTRRTVNGLVGAVFESEPVATLPDGLNPVVQDASGGGISLEQLAQRVVRYTMAKGRCGIFTDFPDTPTEGVSRDLAEKLQPTLTVYQPNDIINWKVEEIEGKDQLTLVVLKEQYIVTDDGFEQTKRDQYRVLRLRNNQYIAELWRPQETTAMDRPWKIFNPTDAKGEALKAIPFVFVGSENNDADIDDPPMYDMASLNIAHYRNSADYEEACYLVGQPTPWFSGLTVEWVKKVWADGKVELGSRAAIPLPENASAGMLQATETSMAFEAMEHKERQMVGLGARLVEQNDTQRTATEAKLEDQSETSVLSNVARNSQSGIEQSLRNCLIFTVGGDQTETKLEYKLNTEFGLSNLPPEELTQVITTWQANGISFTEMRNRLRRGGLATEDDADAKKEIEADQQKADTREATKQTAIAEGAAKAQSKFPKPAPAARPAK